MSARILVVDDSSLARRTLRQILEREGHLVEDAMDGPQAIERYFINRPDVVFLDMVMEGMYGMEVLRKILELHPEARVVVATADIQKGTREAVKAAGAAAIINKPFNSQEIVQVLTTVLQGGMAWN
jgi:two-component system, chemotaxis family, chemotaxis protein CheY